MRKRLLGNAASLAVVQVVNYVAPFIILVHLTKTLGLEIYGVLAFSQGIIAISAVLLDFGYSLSATNKISQNRENKRYVGLILGGVISVKILLYILCCLFVLLYALSTEKYGDHREILLLSLFPIAMQGFAPIWFFHGIEKMKYFAMATISAKVVFALGAVTLVKSQSDYYLVPLLNGAGQLAALISSIYFIYKLGYKIQRPSLRFFSYCFKFTRHFFFSRIAVASYMNGAVVILGLVAQPAVVAIYSMAEQLYKVMQSALGPAAAASYPYMAKEKDVPLMLKLILGVVMLAFSGAIAGYYLAPFLVELVFDKSWMASIPVLNVFLVAIVIHAAAIMTGYPLAAVVGKLEVANSSVMTGAVVYFILLGLAFYLNMVAPTYLAAIMLISEFSVFMHRSIVLLPLAVRKQQPIIPQGNHQ